MKPNRLKIIGALLVPLLFPAVLHAWCWIRDTGNTSQGCPSPSLFTESCCSGTLRRWESGTMPYQISSATPGSLIASMQTGINLWNNVEMSSFFFEYQGTSPLTVVAKDGTNLISIDSTFATDNGLKGQGILAISTTWAAGSGATYRAVESDIIFNGEEFSWGDGTGGTINTMAVVAHESGHSAGLSHAGAECQNDGSEGCGANFEEATMYWNYAAGIPGLRDRTTLELDDVAALIHGYPKSTLRVEVVNIIGEPIAGATVQLLDAAAPRDGTGSFQGGRVYGDVTNSLVLMGDKAPSGSYIDQSPFVTTNSRGFTNTIHPTHRSIKIRVSIAGVSQTFFHTLADGTSTLIVTMSDAIADLVAPLISITSHTSGKRVNTRIITLSGTASDAGRGDNGVQMVTVNGEPAPGGSATKDETAYWSAQVTLTPDLNTITISATDNAPAENKGTRTLLLTYDSIPPVVRSTIPSGSSSEVDVNNAISAEFNEAMAPATLTSATFTNNRGLPGTVSYDKATHTATFTPDTPLADLTTYTFTLTTGVQDEAGNALAAPVSWSFTTRPPPSSKKENFGCFIQTIQKQSR